MKNTLRYMLVLLAAGTLCFCLGWILNKPEPVPVISTPTAAEDPLEGYKSTRRNAYAREIEQLRFIAHDPSAEAEIAALARSRIAQISSRERMECNLEGLLALRGMDAAAAINAYSCYVFVRTELLTAAEAGLIMQLACEESELGNDNVKIIPLNCGNF